MNVFKLFFEIFGFPFQTCALILFLFGLIIMGIFRGPLRLKRYRFEIVTMKPGVNEHKIIDNEELEFKEASGKEIKADHLWLLDRNYIEKLRGVKQKFIIVFRSEETEPITRENVKVSSRILRTVDDSEILRNALKDEFKLPMDAKRLLLIIGAAVIGAVVYLIVTGQLNL